MPEPTPAKDVRRRRRANVTGGRQRRHVVYVSPEEEGRLLLLAGEQDVTVPRLLLEAALSASGETPTERRKAMTELFAVRHQLAGVANNVNQLARKANLDEGFPVEEARDLLRQTRALAGRIDDAIDELAGRGVQA